jgi:hypothetical protein
MKPLACSTWAGIQNEVSRFLGFCSMMEGVETPCLHHCLNGQLVIYFTSFLQERGVAPNQMRDMVSNLSRVCTYLEATSQLSPPVLQLLPAYMTWMDNLSHQVGNLQPLPRPSLQELQQQGKWMEPLLLLQCISSVHLAASSLVWQVEMAGITPTLTTTMHIQQAAMCCLLFGFVPCMRPSMVVSLHVPEYEGPCTWPDCQHKHMCKGNRLVWATSSSSSSSSSSSDSAWGGPQLLVVIVHHKNSNKGWDRSITYALPSDINPLFVYMVRHGQLLLQGQGRVFCLPGGGAMTTSRVRLWWKHVVKQGGATMPPQQARAAFVTLLRDAEREGIVLKGGDLQHLAAAAFAMGTSIRMFRGVYDRVAELRAVQATVDAMKYWRWEVLEIEAGMAAAALQDALATMRAAVAAGGGAAHVAAAAVAAAPARWEGVVGEDGEDSSEGEWEDDEEEEEEWDEGMCDNHPTSEEEPEYY